MAEYPWHSLRIGFGSQANWPRATMKTPRLAMQARPVLPWRPIRLESICALRGLCTALLVNKHVDLCGVLAEVEPEDVHNVQRIEEGPHH